MKKLIMTTLLAVAAHSASAQTADEREVWNHVDALNQAVFVTKDGAAMDKLLDPNVSYSHSNGNTETKPVMIANASASPTTYRNLTTDRISIYVVNGAAVVRHHLKAQQTDKAGKESDLNLGVLQVWIKKDGQWLLAGRQAVRNTVQ
jgi:ketosteroid isomerase-like protein